MKTAIEIYEAFLIELDKYSSPNLQVIDFIHFWNSAVYEFMERELQVYELTNIVSDRLRSVSHEKIFPLNSESCLSPKISFQIPEEYYRLFGVKGLFEWARDFKWTHKKGDQYRKPFKKMTADLEGFAMENRYFRPSPENPFYQILDSKLHFLYGDINENSSSPLFIKEFSIRYIKHPVKLLLSEDFSSFNSSQFSVDVNYMILKIAVINFMGTSEDQRIQLKSKL